MWLIEEENLLKKIEKSRRDNPHTTSVGRRMHDYEHDHFLMMVASQPIIDIETLPLVKELKEKLIVVTEEKNMAIKQLHGRCSVCKHYTRYHNDGLCATCRYERARLSLKGAVDRWEWCGLQKDKEKI